MVRTSSTMAPSDLILLDFCSNIFISNQCSLKRGANMMKKVSLSVFRRDLSKLCRELKDSEDSGLVITKNNLPVAVVISWKRYRALLETIMVLNDPSVMAKADKTAKEFAKGKRGMSTMELKKKLGLPLTEKEERMLKKSKQDIKRGRVSRLV